MDVRVDILPIEAGSSAEAASISRHSHGMVTAHQPQVGSLLHIHLELEQIQEEQRISLTAEESMYSERSGVDEGWQKDGRSDTSQTQANNTDDEAPDSEANSDSLTGNPTTSYGPFLPGDVSYEHRVRLQALQRSLAGIERDNASLREANAKLDVSLKNLEGHSPLGTPSMVVWHDRQTDALIQSLKKGLRVLRSTIDEAVRALSRTIIRQQGLTVAGDANQYLDEVVKLVGEPLTRLIADSGQRSNPVSHRLVQTVIQIFVTNICASKIELLVPNSPEVSDFCLALYQKILDSEGSSVAGNWRALIHANIGLDIVRWEADAMASLMAIMRVAYWSAGDREQLHSFARDLKRIFYMVKKVRFAIREKITSVQIEVSYVPFRSQFSPQFMVNAWPKQDEEAVHPGVGSVPVQCVVGTIAFGLKQLVEGERTPSGDLVYWNILSPDVILESGVQRILARMGGHRAAWKA